MIKKILVSALTVSLVFAFAACGNDEVSQKSKESGTVSKQESDAEAVDDKTDKDKEAITFSETVGVMGFDFYYPEEVYLDHYKYGYTFRYENDIAVLLEGPAMAGVWLELTDINDAPAASEKYVIDTIETRTRDIFSPSRTTQTITNSELKTINDIEMLRVEGFFTNTSQEVDVPFLGYYFLRDNEPVYFVGVPLNEEASVDSFIDEFASYVVDAVED